MSELALKLIAEAKEKRLTKLDLGNCGLTEIPEELFELVWLEELSFSDEYYEWDNKAEKWQKIESKNKGDKNLLSELPQGFAQLQQLKKLILAGHYDNKWQISDLSALSPLTNLTQLDLSSNQLSDVSAVYLLTKMITLDLGFNQLVDVRPLSSLVNLKRLTLMDNQLIDVRPLSSLTNLLYLNLMNNQLTDVSFLSPLTKLIHLHITHNQISDVTPLSLLINLKWLHLGSNKLIDVSPLSSLMNLTTLGLDNNQIIDISSLINIIDKGMQVKLEGLPWKGGIFITKNPLEIPPPEIIEQGNQAILTYFEDLKQQGTGKLNEAKLIIVGEPAAGKTTLMECLLDPDYTLSNNTQSTLGIEVREGWQFPHPHTEQADTPFTANIWDFGGQQIQYMTHQFFLTPSALYILVSANDRKEPTNFPYWFKIIHLLGEEQGRYSPVLVVLNEKDKQFINKFNFDLKFYQDRYPELQISQCEVDLSQRDQDSRFNVLREKIQKQLSQLPHVTDDRPARWNPIRDALRKLAQQKDYINFAEYAAICQQYGVDNEDSQKVLSGYLHRLGSLLHFVHDPILQDFIILKPQWAVDAVYSVLRDNEIASKDGYFSQQKLDKIWQKYSVNERVNLLNLMKQENFEICYELKNNDTNKHYIAPQLLSDKQPFYKWNDSECLKFRFQYTFMPEGIITRLIVRLNDLIAQHDGCDLAWRKGVVLTQNGCRARVREEENRDGLKVIDIAVTGDSNNRKYLLNSIREEIRQIHRKWFKNIQAEQMIPCVCDYCVNPEHKEITYFKFSTLERARERGKATVECDKEFLDVPVMVLLEGVFEEKEIERHERGFGDGVREVHNHTHHHNHVGGDNTSQQPEPPITPSPEPEPSKPEEKTVWWKEAWFSAVIATILTALVIFGLLVNWVETLSTSLSGFIALGVGAVAGFVVYKMRTYNPYRTIGWIALSFVLLNNVSFLSGKLNSTIGLLGQQAKLSLAWGDPLNVFVSLALLAYSGFALYLAKQTD